MSREASRHDDAIHQRECLDFTISVAFVLEGGRFLLAFLLRSHEASIQEQFAGGKHGREDLRDDADDEWLGRARVQTVDLRCLAVETPDVLLDFLCLVLLDFLCLELELELELVGGLLPLWHGSR